MAVRSSHIIRNRSFPLTQDEASCLANVDPITIGRWGSDDNPPPRDPDGSYPAKEFGMWMMKHQTRKRGPGSVEKYPYAPEQKLLMPGMPGTHLSKPPTEAQTKLSEEIRRTAAQADKIEMENREMAGHLIPIEEIEPALAEMVTRVKNRLLKLPVALATLVLGDNDVYSVEQKLRDGVRDALSEVSVDWKSGVAAGVEQDH